MTFDPKEARALVERLDGYTPGPWTWETESGEWPDHQIIGGDGDSVLWWDFDLGFRTACDRCTHLISAAPDLHATLTAALDEIERLREALTLIERLYYLEDKDAGWRASRMNGVAREAQDGGDLGGYHRIFPRAALAGEQP